MTSNERANSILIGHEECPVPIHWQQTREHLRRRIVQAIDDACTAAIDIAVTDALANERARLKREIDVQLRAAHSRAQASVSDVFFE